MKHKIFLFLLALVAGCTAAKPTTDENPNPQHKKYVEHQKQYNGRH